MDGKKYEVISIGRFCLYEEEKVMEVLFEISKIVLGLLAVVSVIASIYSILDKDVKGLKKVLNVFMFLGITSVSLLAFFVTSLFGKVPNVIGKNVAYVQQALSDAGFEFECEQGYTFDSDDIVYSISEKEGAVISRNTVITIYCNKIIKENEDNTDIEETNNNQNYIKVPNVIGMEQNAAGAELKKMGLDFRVWWNEENNTIGDNYYVIGQSIPADSFVIPGAIVKLEISPIKP